MKDEQNEFIVKNRLNYGYNETIGIEKLRELHFSRLQDPRPSIFLDHAGTTLPSEILLKNSFDLLSITILQNPHSGIIGKQSSHEIIEQSRQKTLDWFNAKSLEYSAVFTSSCTASIKLVAENFPFSTNSKLRYTISNHSSCLGIREYALSRGATVEVVDNEDDEKVLHVIAPTHDEFASAACPSQHQGITNHLFVYPAESNFSGIKFPLQWIHKYKNNATANERWFVLLDASAYVPLNSLDLSLYPFDFVCFSFHKIFGYPTGLGALLLRNEVGENVLSKKYFGGGSVSGILATERFQVFRSSISERYEDGTIPFSLVATLKFGFHLLESLGGMSAIARHSHSLTQYLYTELSKLQHYNGAKLCTIYGRHYENNPNVQGAIVSFIMHRADSQPIGYSEVEKLASVHSIYIRTGCFCNAGECQSSIALTPEDVKAHISEGHVCWDDNDIIMSQPTGAVRLSLGYMSNFEDCFRFVNFLKTYFIERTPSMRHVESSRVEACTKAILSGIIVYPIKSCAGYRIESWQLGNKGLLWDRCWALIDHQHRAISGKNEPLMFQIRPSLHLADDIMVITAPAMEPLTISLSEDTHLSVQIRVCGDSCTAMAYPKEVDEWFCTFLGRTCRLVKQAVVEEPRLCKLKEIKRIDCALRESIGVEQSSTDDSAQQVSFSNESQLLVVNLESILHLRQTIINNSHSLQSESIQTTIDRFRPNLVISGCPPNSEDYWEFLELGDLKIRCLGPCARCRMITVSPTNGELHPDGEPLSSLATYRRTNGRILFGRHASLQEELSSPKELANGDTCTILAI